MAEELRISEPEKSTIPKEKPKNCSFCNRALRKKSWYYRNGKYFCRKKCWKDAQKGKT